VERAGEIALAGGELADENPLRQEQVETPTPKANEIRIRIVAYGVCHTDLRVVEGDIHPTRK
jgi:D-arabinose 1-dehydrogenase-like Zn-dependent alcohol dehydrogenase